MERFHGILIEHYAGAFPLWLAPTQVAVVPISTDRHLDYAQKIYDKFRKAGVRALLDDRSESMNYKIRELLQDKKVPYVLVVGDREEAENTVAVRARGVGQVGAFNADEFLAQVQDEIAQRK
jgi:threonyl-tRNA synthetase